MWGEENTKLWNTPSEMPPQNKTKQNKTKQKKKKKPRIQNITK